MILKSEFSQLVTISILTLILLLLINIQTTNIIHNSLRGLLGLIFIFFLSGYSLIIFLSKENLEPVEILIFSIGMSICITILDAMIIHLTSSRVNLTNIMNLVASTTLIFLILTLFKKYFLGGTRYGHVWRR